MDRSFLSANVMFNAHSNPLVDEKSCFDGEPDSGYDIPIQAKGQTSLGFELHLMSSTA